jgi:hypothetical protein
MKEIINQEIFDSYDKIEITNLFIKLFEKDITNLYIEKKFLFEKFNVEKDTISESTDSFLYTNADEDATELDFDEDDINLEELEDESSLSSSNKKSENDVTSSSSSSNSKSSKISSSNDSSSSKSKSSNRKSILGLFFKKGNLFSENGTYSGNLDTDKLLNNVQSNYVSIQIEDLEKYQLLVTEQLELFKNIYGDSFESIYGLENNNIFLSFFKMDLNQIYVKNLELFESELSKLKKKINHDNENDFKNF